MLKRLNKILNPITCSLKWPALFERLTYKQHITTEPSRLELYNTVTASLQRVRPPTNKCLGYDIKQLYGEDPALEL